MTPFVAAVAQVTTGTHTSVEALHAALERATGAPPRAMADHLHQLLANRVFRTTRDSRGQSTRALCVELLMRLGFPYALEVHPTDLQCFRNESGDAEVPHPTLALSFISLVSFIFYATIAFLIGEHLSDKHTGGLAYWGTVLALVGLIHTGVTIVQSVFPMKSLTTLKWVSRGGPVVMALTVSAIFIWQANARFSMLSVPFVLMVLAACLPSVATALISTHEHSRIVERLTSAANEEEPR